MQSNFITNLTSASPPNDLEDVQDQVKEEVEMEQSDERPESRVSVFERRILEEEDGNSTIVAKHIR